MKACTEKQKEWLWFAGLWCGGLVAALAMARAVRWMLAI